MIQIESTHLSEMISHAREDAPREACGILAGTEQRVLRLYRAANAQRSRTSYSLDPREQYRIFRDIEDRELTLVAIYHSHPSSPATPSDTDIELAYYPEVAHVLISLVDPDQPQVRAFRIAEGRVAEEDIVII